MEDIGIHQLVKDRWSPRLFKNVEISESQIGLLFEAARWAPSSRNSQPWRFVYATKKDGELWNKLFGALTEFNQQWVKTASHLMVACIVKSDSLGRERKHAWYDLGLAIGNLTVQANSMGIYVRNMGGFEPAVLRESLTIPTAIEPVVMLALGYPDESIKEHPDFEITSKENRKREPLEKLLYTGSWEELIG